MPRAAWCVCMCVVCPRRAWPPLAQCIEDVMRRITPHVRWRGRAPAARGPRGGGARAWVRLPPLPPTRPAPSWPAVPK
jgi:hypothetical protein